MARKLTAASASVTASPPVPQTDAQLGDTLGRYSMASWGAGLVGCAPDPGTFDTYRRMRMDPTITMARAAATAPIKSAGWSWKADDDAPAGSLQFVQDTLDRLVPSILREVCFALDYGFQSAELVWLAKGGAWVIDQFKPLLPELTKIRVTQSGDFAGLEQKGGTLDTFHSFLFTHDREGDNHYGRARHENIREHAWAPWVETAKRKSAYFAKAAGVIPQVTYPVGKSRGKDGAEVDNFDIGTRLLAEMSSGKGVLMPWSLQKWAESALAKGADPMTLMAWRIQFLETRAGHGSEFLEDMRYLDSLKMRGWLVPERVALEGQHGTLAEAGAHADIAIACSEEVLTQAVGDINAQLVDPLLAVNFGPDVAGKVRMEAAPIVDTERDYIRALIKDILVQPGNLDLFLETLDLDSALDQAGLPKVRETIDQASLLPAKPDPATVAPVQPKNGGNPPPPAPLAAAMLSSAARRSGYARSISRGGQ